MEKAVLIGEREEAGTRTISIKGLKQKLKERVFDYLLRNRDRYVCFNELCRRVNPNFSEEEFRYVLNEGLDDVLPPGVIYERFNDIFGVKVLNERKYADIYKKGFVQKIKINGIKISVKPTNSII